MALKRSASTALEQKRQVKTTPGTLYGLSGFSTLATAQYIQLHDSVAEPSAGAVPRLVLKASGDFHFSIDAKGQAMGLPFDNGIWVVNSTTAATYTAGAANCLFQALYV